MLRFQEASKLSMFVFIRLLFLFIIELLSNWVLQ